MNLSFITKHFETGSFRRYFINTSWLFLENILKIISAFIVGIFVIRYLGPEKFGVLSYVISFVYLFSIFTKLGLDQIVVRELVKAPEKKNYILGTACGLKMFGSIAGILFILLFIFILPNGALIDQAIILVSLTFLFSSFEVIDLYFQAQVKSKYPAYARIGQLLFSGISKAALIFLRAPLIYFIYVIIGEIFVVSAILIFNYLRQGGAFKGWRFDFSIAKRLLKDSTPLFFSAIAVTIYMKIDQVMIKFVLDVQEVGIYASAVKISEAVAFVPVVVAGSLFPAIINLKTKDSRLYTKRIQQFFNILSVFAYLIVLPVFFGSSELVHFLFGDNYGSASEALRILVWANFAVFLGVASSKWLVAENLTQISFLRTFIGGIVNIILNILFIPRYGIQGAACATLLSYSAATFSILFFSKSRKCGLMMFKSLAPIKW